MNALPSLFVSHGAPTWALEPGMAGLLLGRIGETLPRPAAVLVVSPHWTTRDIAVSAASQPRTIHDFGGFPEALYRLQYPAPGHPQLARRAAAAVAAAGFTTTLDERRGLDHGAWVPLRYLYPDAEVPVFQVSLPSTLDASAAWRMGEALAPLAKEGVLIVGSGSLTHNLHEFRSGSAGDAPYAVEFVEWVRNAVRDRDVPRLKDALSRAPHAARAHPTPEHFWPLLVAAGAWNRERPARVLEGGMTYGMLSMESYLFGATEPTKEVA